MNNIADLEYLTDYRRESGDLPDYEPVLVQGAAPVTKWTEYDMSPESCQPPF